MNKQQRAARTRDALIRSAAELFERHGYDKARLAEISSGAGVSSGALHFHFENKAAVADAVEDAACLSLRRAAHKVSLCRTSPLQALTDVSHIFAYLLSCDVVVSAGFRLSCDPTRQKELNLRQEWHSCVQQLLTRASDDDILTREVSLQHLVASVMAATVGLEVLGRDNKEWLSRRSLTGLWQLLLPRMAARHAQDTVDPSGTDLVINAWALSMGSGSLSPPAR
ncbi:hypothetical protein DB35_13465 [Streptomyces abyssalis]|uniref:HTH tetR-type domain-containing protein n=1 Tax=Streptomyces abyssalis TaxID=933944 RepID=A0A1E7JGQ0_9ACTN|nr:ScbR family autoregulator-binding transcription factor [Streptomyces abyssalis]OEU85632.1 hypothetical protein AN215_24520 [Streptomyces abyssalis]OEU92903.1 hypothetical protein DB35_13465 [Streptomyces abyssalis]OEV30530.1 hypothetical protein AN219_10540 [Streptomyces nanshensis]